MRTLILLLGSVLLSACASSPTYLGNDEHYMARVEYGARLSGAQVYWVNPPQVQQPADVTPPPAPVAP